MRRILFVLAGGVGLLSAGCGDSPHYLEIDGGGDAAVGVDADEVDAVVDAGGIDATTLSEGMVFVGEGEFSMGCNVIAGCGPYPSMLPYHDVQLSAFAIDRLETSVAEYFDCIDAGVCTVQPTGVVDPTSTLPVRVTWQAAVTYCAWRGRRLPTEAEWEKAARSYDGRQYPWGDIPPLCKLAQFSDCMPNQLVTVDSLPDGASIYGAQHMAGNMWEWTADWYAADYYASSPMADPQGPASGSKRSVRGGDYLDGATHIRTWYRREFDPGSGAGIRCAVSM